MANDIDLSEINFQTLKQLLVHKLRDSTVYGVGQTLPVNEETVKNPYRACRDEQAAHEETKHKLEAALAQVKTVDDPKPSVNEWRVGSHYEIHVHEGDRPVATFHQSADAKRAVAAVNAVAGKENVLPDQAISIIEEELKNWQGGAAQALENVLSNLQKLVSDKSQDGRVKSEMTMFGWFFSTPGLAGSWTLGKDEKEARYYAKLYNGQVFKLFYCPH